MAKTSQILKTKATDFSEKDAYVEIVKAKIAKQERKYIQASLQYREVENKYEGIVPLEGDEERPCYNDLKRAEMAKEGILDRLWAGRRILESLLEKKQ